jgi:Protein of unknown function (DUF2950)
MWKALDSPPFMFRHRMCMFLAAMTGAISTAMLATGEQKAVNPLRPTVALHPGNILKQEMSSAGKSMEITRQKLMNLSNLSRQLAAALFAVACTIWLEPLQAQEEKSASPQRLFASPEQATTALLEAARTKDKTALHEIFGPDAQELLTGDAVQDAANFQSFSRALAEKCLPEPEGDDKVILNIGAQNWPFPIPLIKKDGQWLFDTDAGREEIINRHIGKDELNAIGVCHAYVEAQREYFCQDRDGNGMRKYAQKFKSTPGKRDGLYWQSTRKEEASPFGPLVAEAHAEGYGNKENRSSPQPFHGYFFKILFRQGGDAPGGKSNYIVHGNMTGGFALLAYPARWNQSGVMTFIVNQQGLVYQRNLGEKTATTAAAMTRYDPDSTWMLTQEYGITEMNNSVGGLLASYQTR